jgi:hypothetical protein
MNYSHEELKFKELLEGQYYWPDYYFFRFVCPLDSKQEFVSVLEGLANVEKMEITPSPKENYFSIHFRSYINRSDEVIHIYRALSHFQNVFKI